MAILLLASVEIQRLLAEYGIDGFRTIRRRLQQHGLSARRPWLRLPLKLHLRQERLQWCDQRRIWVPELQDVVFSGESKFCLQHQDVTSVFGGIVVNARWQRAFVIVILAHHLA
ncbi:hypothetical protein TNCV_60181 [Trichonephila clavipes]|nr:hypothetical protein TNCV_60181 [Trichonephila clavipes]